MTVITAGVKSLKGATVVRQELREFIKDKYLLNLYLLGLQHFQQADQAQLLSWFQVCGIHGRPYRPYDRVGDTSASNFGGYCTHSSTLFPTWHRPYLALFEQTLTSIVADIANHFTTADKQKYIDASHRFCIPYWDWAFDTSLPDIVAKQETISVTNPNGSVQTIKNPLYSYTFHPLYSDFGDGLANEKTWESWQSTVRWPSRNDATGRSQPQLMQRQLANNRLTIRDRTYNLLTQTKDYAAFSNDGFLEPGMDPMFYDSLESIHGQIHGLTGGNGHMGVVDYAGFDPLFWLHHANVDRLFAIWQALNPKSFVVARENDGGTFTTPPGTIEDARSPLTPFWQEVGLFWTSDAVRDVRTFSYTYPELDKLSRLPEGQRDAALRKEVNRLYGHSAPVAAVKPGVFSDIEALFTVPSHSQASKTLADVVGGAQALLFIKPTDSAPSASDVSAQSVGAVQEKAHVPPTAKHDESHSHSTTSGAAPHEQPKQDIEILDPDMTETVPKEGDKLSYHEWVANIRVKKYAVQSTFFVHVFLGDFNKDPTKWGEDPNLVGSHVVFANNIDHTGCKRCIAANEEDKLVTGTIPLTGALGDKLGQSHLAHLEPELVVPYLRSNLHWRIQKHDQTVIEREDIPSLNIFVGHAVVEAPCSAGEFPVWGDIKIHLGVTTGRVGGANQEV